MEKDPESDTEETCSVCEGPLNGYPWRIVVTGSLAYDETAAICEACDKKREAHLPTEKAKEDPLLQ